MTLLWTRTQLTEGNQQFMSVGLTLWLAKARLPDIAGMNDMAVERELYTNTDWEEQISIDDVSGNLPPHQEPSSGSEDSVDEEDVEPEDGT
jgi:hypothetical protein